jgi:hypothetical protein
MRLLHDLLMGASVVLLDPFAGDPVAPVTITVPSNDAVAARAIDKIEHADQMELTFP